jgi:hypothetical protein
MQHKIALDKISVSEMKTFSPSASGVQLGARGADSFRERGFDIHVHVFKRSVPLEFAGLDLLFDCAQFALDFLSLIDCHHLCLRECRGVCDRSCDIVSIELQSNETDSL